MNRRDMLLTAGAAAIGLSAFPLNLVATTERDAAEKKRHKVLYFTRSAGFQHPPVIRKGDELSDSEKLLTKWGKKAGLDVVCTKDGAVFDGDLGQFDAFIFYTSGDLTGKCERPQPGAAMSPEGKKKFLAAIEAGKGFVGIHSATDSFRSAGVDPYTAMIGAEFLTHGNQQEATMEVVSPKFPGMKGLGKSFAIHEEWYAQHKFAKDLRVILVQETKGMTGEPYQRPPYPATWARMQGKGRVFYTSMGHDEIWRNKIFRQVLMGGIAWAVRDVDADVKPNIAQVTPGANKTKNETLASTLGKHEIPKGRNHEKKEIG
jgi:type 1 glutamine amidotransferase